MGPQARSELAAPCQADGRCPWPVWPWLAAAQGLSPAWTPPFTLSGAPAEPELLK